MIRMFTYLRELYRKIYFPSWSIPAAITLLGLLAYGVLLPTWGLYWDDWAKISVARLYGLSGYWAYYAGDRPLSSWTHILLTPVLGFHPLGWHIFQFGVTVLAAWGVYWTLICLLPGAQGLSASAAMIFLVYPVFTAHPAAVTFHQQWLQYALILLSLGAMLTAVRARSRKAFTGLTVLSLALGGLHLAITEYFASLELIRLLLLWIVVGQMGDDSSKTTAWPRLLAQARQTIRYATPYLLLLVAYGAYRFLIRPFRGEDPYGMVTLYQVIANPASLPGVLRVWLGDSLHTLISIWGPLLVAGTFERVTPFQILTLALSLSAALCSVVFLVKLAPSAPGVSTRQKQALAVGAAAFFLGMLPGWLTGHSVMEDFHADRYALPAMFGAALLWAVAIDWITPARLQRALLVAALVGLGAGQQLRSGNEYRWLWETETRFFWQLYWRAPHLEAGTALFTYQEIFPNQGLFSSSAALNLLYPMPATQKVSGDLRLLPYWWYTLSPRYDINKLEEPIQLSMQTQFRSLAFQGGSPNTLLLHYDPAHSNCLWVITDEDQDEPGLPALVKAMRSISNTQQIRAEPQDGWRPPTELFGPEPEHDWCYLYEKADLARQLQDWQQAALLGDQARAAGYGPGDSRSNAPREWAPFIEAYARVGRWSEAAELTRQAAQRGKEFHPSLARLWENLIANTPDTPARQEAVQSITPVLYTHK